MVRTKGRLLVATPPLVDPNFDRTVVLMLEHNDDGALGLVLNRPSATAVGDVLPAWHGAVVAPPVVHYGGPVQPDGAIGLARLGAGAGPGEGLFTPALGDLGTVDLDADPSQFDLVAARVFAGYSGWGPGQLDGELDQRAWIVVPADAGDAFHPSPASLWRAVLARQGGRLAWLAGFPDDVRVN